MMMVSKGLFSKTVIIVYRLSQVCSDRPNGPINHLASVVFAPAVPSSPAATMDPLRCPVQKTATRRGASLPLPILWLWLLRGLLPQPHVDSLQRGTEFQPLVTVVVMHLLHLVTCY